MSERKLVNRADSASLMAKIPMSTQIAMYQKPINITTLIPKTHSNTIDTFFFILLFCNYFNYSLCECPHLH